MTNEISARGAAIELAVRKTWALNKIAELVNAGRAGGWLAVGEPVDVIDAAVLVTTCEAGLAAMDTPMRRLASGASLDARETDALWLLACIELEPRITNALKLLLPSDITVQMLERAVYGDAAAPTAARMLQRLRDLGLVEVSTDASIPLQRRAVRASDRVLELARGALGLDGALDEVATLHGADAAAPRCSIPASIAQVTVHAGSVLIVISGATDADRVDTARAAIASQGRSTLLVRGDALAGDTAILTRQLRVVTRECLLHKAWPIVTDLDRLGERAVIVERTLHAALACPIFTTAAQAIPTAGTRPVVSAAAIALDESDRAARWASALPAAGSDVIAECASKYRLAGSTIARIGETISHSIGSDLAATASDVQRALRTELESKLVGVATRVETAQTWNDLVLPGAELELLVELCARVKFKDQVLGSWGFANKVGRGSGVTALFSGPPGTGKTMIAGLVAKELGLDLYQIDLSKIVSKYIGETEKQLAAIFDAAEAGHAILLFDEADSLFGKRTEVKSSTDRYANLETNYLLQRIEAFTGIAILTTNHETAIDRAFMRRLTTHIRVPAPERSQREQIWKAMIPAEAHVAADLDLGALAQKFEMTGGYIKNAVVRAAFLAAADGQAISTTHLWRAARAEYDAMGRIA